MWILGDEQKRREQRLRDEKEASDLYWKRVDARMAVGCEDLASVGPQDDLQIALISLSIIAFGVGMVFALVVLTN